jgi:hypothetical protein
MSNYRILNLPDNPIISEAAFLAAVESCGPEMATKDKLYFEPEKLIKPEILKTFADLGLTPTFVVIFYRPGWFACRQKTQDQSKVHTDITVVNNAFVKVPCSINWEITPGETFFTWWNTKDAPEAWPKAMPQPGTYDYVLNSLMYNSRQNFDYSNYEKVEEVKCSRPMLVKVDVPHSVVYNTGDQVRLSFSIRFNVADTISWEHALELFKPLIIE